MTTLINALSSEQALWPADQCEGGGMANVTMSNDCKKRGNNYRRPGERGTIATGGDV